MGVKGLLALFKDHIRKVNVDVFRGQKVAVDGYAWLHRGALACARQLALKQPASAHIAFCVRFVGMLLSKGVQVVLVFDGATLPAKAAQEALRSKSREENLAQALQLEAEGQSSVRHFASAVDITPEDAHALQLAVEARTEWADKVECITAPYEVGLSLELPPSARPLAHH